MVFFRAFDFYKSSKGKNSTQITFTTGTSISINNHIEYLHFMLLLWNVEYEQWSHENRLFSTCLVMCIFNSGSSLNDAPHLSHMNGRIPRWTLRSCLLRPLNKYWHTRTNTIITVRGQIRIQLKRKKSIITH